MSATPRFDPGLLDPPDDATVDKAIADYARAIREAYGPRVKGIYLFGSRARGDRLPESDADIAVILEGDAWKFWTEMKSLSDLGYDILIDTGADVQGWPVHESHWLHPETHSNPALVRAMQRDGRSVDLTA